jgi:DNA gyrase subunit A
LVNVEHITGGLCFRDVLDDMLETGALREVRGALIPSDKLTDECDRRKMHTVLSEPMRTAIWDAGTGEVLAYGESDPEGELLFLGGGVRRISRSASGKMFAQKVEGRKRGVLASLPTARRGLDRGLSRSLVWALAEMEGRNPRRWALDEYGLVTWGGFRYNLLLAAVLKKAEERAHILEGLKIALENLDEVVALIRRSGNPQEAKTGLVERFGLSVIQAQAILDMRLQRLTAMERSKILEEYAQLLKDIERYKAILSSDALVLDIIEEELLSLKRDYADARRTEIVDAPDEINVEDLIAEEDMVVTISHSGYIKRSPLSLYRSQKRGGRGVSGHQAKEDDFISDLFVASTHDYFLFLTNKGHLFWLKVYELPEGSRATKGKALVNLLPIDTAGGERIASVTPVRTFDAEHFLVMATRSGVVKKTSLEAFSRPRPAGIWAATINEGDELIAAAVTNGASDIFLATRKGISIRFHEDDIRSMGRTAAGVRGIHLEEGDSVVAMVVIPRDEGSLLTVTEHGFGKRTALEEYRVQSRAGKGIINIKVNEKIGEVVGVIHVVEKDEIMLIGAGGNVIRMKVSDVREIGRSTQGVKLINLEPGDRLTSVARLAEQDD